MRKTDGGFVPDDHQFLPMDMLASGWLSLLGVNSGLGIPRTRVLIADEGGTGKTLTASLAIRYASIINSGGPIIVLVPPLLIDHWFEHLSAVFFDEPERIEILSSAKYFNETHYDRIVIVSKWSWSKHFERHVKKHIDNEQGRPCCVLIDEAHQGRTGNEPNWEKFSDIKYAGAIGIEEDDIEFNNVMGEQQFSSLRSSMSYTCRKSKYAIGVTATPINLQLQELNNIMKDLSADGYVNAPDFVADTNYTKLIGKLMRKSRKGFQPMSRAVLFQPLNQYIEKNGFPSLWYQQGLTTDDCIAIQDWLDDETVIESDLALRVLKDLHPYGKHLSITLRSDLNKNNTDDFRIRETEVLEINSASMMPVWKEVLHEGSPLISDNMKSLKQSALIFNSHRTNIYRLNEKGKQMYQSLSEQKSQYPPIPYFDKFERIEDLRLVKLMEKFRSEANTTDENSDSKEIRNEKIGAVFFSEWLGTIDPAGLKADIENYAQKYFTDIEFKVDILTNGLGLNSLKSKTQKMERYALKKHCFPILISSPAGEVGIEMAWASNLIHWDLNPNPQRLEQRTWRLDRRIRQGQKIKKRYKVFFLGYDNGNNLFEVFRKRINQRWKSAALALGLPGEQEYIANKTNEITGVDKSAVLSGKEIIDFHSFVNGSNIKPFTIHKQRLKSFIGLRTMGFDVTTSILDEGIFELFNHMFEDPDTYLKTNKSMSLIRDLELLPSAIGLARTLVPNYKDGQKTNYLVHMSQLNNNLGRGLPLFDKLVTRIGQEFTGDNREVICLPKNPNDNILAVAVSNNIRKLHEQYHLSETGILLKTDEGWSAWSSLENQDQIGVELITIIQSLDSLEKQEITFEEHPRPSCKQKIEEIDVRLTILNQYMDGKRIKSERCQKKQEEDDLTDEESEWLTEVIAQTESELSQVEAKIEQISELYNKQDYEIIFSRS